MSVRNRSGRPEKQFVVSSLKSSLRMTFRKETGTGYSGAQNITMMTQLEKKAAWLRREVFEMVVRAKKGHFPSSSSCTEILVSLLYGGYLKFDPKNPKWSDRDRLFISKGHAGMALYPILADLGYISEAEIAKFTHPDGILKFYPDPTIPGVEAITGSLGHGMGIAAGHCLAGRLDGRDFRSYVIVSDGECYEGSTWETALFAAHQRLEKLVVFVDRNGCCIMDHTENCVRLDPLEEKWRAFGWRTFSINAHDLKAIDEVLRIATTDGNGQPTAIIAHSIKGKGVSFMENQPGWHNRMPNTEEILQAREELSRGALS